MTGVPFSTKERLKRLSILSTTVAGKDVRVVDIKGDTPPRPYLPVLHRMAHPALLADHGFAWSDGEAIFLPVSIIDMKTEDEQEHLIKTLIFFLSAQIRYGTLDWASLNRVLLEGDRLVADLYWIIENARLLRIIKRDYPGLFRAWGNIISHLMAGRPSSRHINRIEEKVEGFLKDVLEDNGAVSTRTPEESLALAKALKDKWAEEVLPVRRYRAMVPFTPWGKLIPGRVRHETTVGTHQSGVEEAERTVDSVGQVDDDKKDQARNRYMTRREVVDEKANEQGLMLNIYDKILTWAEFVNVERQFDDEPEGDNTKKADEMDELTTAELKRSTTTRFDADLELAEARKEDKPADGGGAGGIYLYPEWDYRRQGYRKGYSTLTEKDIPGGPLSYVEGVMRDKCGLIKEVRRKFEMLSPDLRLSNRLPDGEDIDIDAAVEAAVDLAAGKHPGEKLYISYRRTERDLSVLFLMDLSMSTEAWINEKRVIDHEKESLVVLCEAIEKLKDRYAIYGFSGKTRKGCGFFHIKEFGEGYGERVKSRIGGILPCQYTRMGPAVRHATEILRKQPSKVKLLFLITDGKPNDTDEYEGRYGVEDTRKAVKEAEGQGIVPFCLAVDNNAHEYLGRIFGKGNHVVLSDVDKLVRKLPELYARILRGL